MEDLIILGTGVHGGEMVDIVERINRVEKTWNLLGFVVQDEKDLGAERAGVEVLGTLADIGKYPEALLIPDNEWPRTILLPSERLASLVDPSVYVSRTARIGRGSVLYPNSFVGCNATIGDYVFCLSGSVINHDNVIEDRVVFASGVTLAGHVHVEADSYLGQSSTVKQFVRIGRGSLIGMGAVVTRDVAPQSVMVGSPARRVRERKPGEN